MDWQALGVSLRLAGLTTLLLAAFGLPLSWWIAQSPSTPRRLVAAVTLLPLMLPPTVLGFYLLLALGPTTAFGRVLIRITGHPLAFTFTGLVIGSMLYSLPFAVQPLVAGFSALDRESLDAAATLGAGPWQRFWRVGVPGTRSALMASLLLIFAHTMGEFGVVLMIGGSIPGQTRTLALALYDQVQDFQYAQAQHTALLLIGVSALALLALYRLTPIRSPR